MAVEVFEGNASEQGTLSAQVNKLRKRFDLQRVVMVGDRGILTSARIREELADTEGLDWITALRAPTIKKLAADGALELSLFDQRDLAEIQHPDFPGERLVVCRNPLLAVERARKREELLQATETKLEEIRQATLRPKRRLQGKARIGMRVGRDVNRFKVGKHFQLQITAQRFFYARKEEAIAAEAALDGIYVIRTSVPAEAMDADSCVASYKDLAAVERAFRSLKSVDLKIRHNSPLIEFVIIVFMVFSGLHFGLLYAAAAGSVRSLWTSDVVRYYLGALGVGVLICTFSLHLREGISWLPALRVAAFQVVSVGTSTGFATTDTAVWPGAARLILLFMTLQCACSGSTSGGIKADRMVILGRAIVRHVRQLMHPRGVLTVRREGHAVGRQVVEESLLYITVYLGIVLAASLVLAALGVDLLSAFSGAVATMGNVGPGLGSVGSTGSFGHLPAAAKWVLSVTMLLGHLEIFALILLLTPGHWRGTAGY